MARNQQDRKQATKATDLLNFHFSTSPPPQQTSRSNLSSPSSEPRSRQRRPAHHQQNQQHYHHHRQQNQQQHQNRRSKEDRASARRKPSSAMFYLHSSADHAFVLTRRVRQQSAPSSTYTFSGPDEPVSWEAVRMVKYLAPAAPTTTTAATADAITDMTASCPICLDSFTCARITKCGHCFCLPCLLRHVHSHTAQNVYTHVKCPCCGIPLHVEDLRFVVIESVQPPRVGSSMSFVKLHRYKHCHAPYLPLEHEQRHLSPHAAPCITDVDAAYTRFNYVDPFSYQAHLESNEGVLQKEVANLSRQRKCTGENYHLDMEILFYTMSLETVQKELQRARDEAEEEQALIDRYNGPSSGVYQPQPTQLTARHLLNNDLSSKAATTSSTTSGYPNTTEIAVFDMDPLHSEGSVPLDDDARFIRRRRDSVESEHTNQEGAEEGNDDEMLNTGGHRRYRGDSIGSEMSADNTPNVIRRGRSESITSHGSVESDRIKPQQQRMRKLEERPLPDLQASMYLDHDCTHFYQSKDGQLCFLSRFNMTCLLSDYSTWPQEVPLSTVSLKTAFQRRKVLPLPDVVEGKVLETETIHLTPEVRKRMPFLSHVPLYTDVCFVELDLNHILSDVTKYKLKADFEKRRLRRKIKIDAQKRADRIAKEKEEARVNELKSRLQRVDPNDDFFHPPTILETAILTGDDFGPSLSSSSINHDTEQRNVSASEANGSGDDVVVASPLKSETLTFSQICRSRSAVSSPIAESAATQREEFPALGSTLASSNGAPTASGGRTSVPAGWNDRVKAAYVAKKESEDDVHSTIEELSISPNIGGKKKSRGKKIVLFSTGGQRGSAS